ncbi:hypothetical protein BDN67DRAFT_1015821 [Paxillus ammoniavirescens]|nr:hypothetical protein BDN67DRAFT_1015821 [Paxillus ammoniavirescens]
MVLEDVEEELILDSGLCSRSFSSLLLSVESIHGLGCCIGVVALSECSELIGGEGGGCVNDEPLSMFRDWKGWEEMFWAVEPMRGWISWVVSTGNVVGGDTAHSSGSFKKFVYLSEDSVDSGVVMPSNMPTFDDTRVVTIDLDMLAAVKDSIDSTDE